MTLRLQRAELIIRPSGPDLDLIVGFRIAGQELLLPADGKIIVEHAPDSTIIRIELFVGSVRYVREDEAS